ncbi:hypothetical protein GJAV_G00248740 [Gymnothorax javanicus]|nr:hypothetical protein GJAV_G00248740 [Gymnothorax javanicus]
MSNSTAFHTQIASIMEVLANAAVAEICQVVDDGYAVLRLEISQYQKENKTLKRRLQMVERQAARRCAEKAGMRANFADRALVSRKFRDPASAVRVLENQSDISQRDDGQPIVLDEEDTPMEGAARGDGVTSYQDTANAECIYMEEGRTESLLIQEKLKENQGTSGHQGVLKNRDERGVESDAGGEGRLYPSETQPGAEKQEQPPVQPRAKCSVWDVGGDSEEESVKNPQQLGTDSKIQRANGMDSDFGMFDRTGQLGSYCAQGGSLTEKHDPFCSFSTETGPQGQSFHSEMRSFSAAEDGRGNSLSPLGSLDWKPDIIVVDSVPVKQESEIPPAWKGGSVLGMAGVLRRPFDEIGERGEILPESVASVCLPPPQISAGLNATISKHVTAESDDIYYGCSPVVSSFPCYFSSLPGCMRWRMGGEKSRR